MTTSGPHPFHRFVAWLVVAALLLPTLNACVTTNPPALRIDGVVVDGERRTPEQEGGWVRVVRNGITYDGYAGMELQNDDRVETTARAEAVIRWPNGNEVLMRPNSGGRIGSFKDIVGEVFVKVKGIFSADTTFVRAGAQGTQYLVRAMPNGTTYVLVFEGTVSIDSTRNSWATVLLRPGDATLAYPRPPEPYRASPEELRHTQEWVERLERMVPVQTSLSPTGVVIGIGIAAAVAAILTGGGGGGGSRPQPSNSDRAPAPGVPSTPATPTGVVPSSRPAPASAGTVPPPRLPGTTTATPGVYVPPARAPGTSRVPGTPSTTGTRTVPATAATRPTTKTGPAAAATGVAPAASPVAKPRDTRAVIRKPASPASSPAPVVR